MLVCLCSTCVFGACRDQKKAMFAPRSDGLRNFLELGIQLPDPLEEQPVCLTAEPSLEPLWLRFLKQELAM